MSPRLGLRPRPGSNCVLRQNWQLFAQILPRISGESFTRAPPFPVAWLTGGLAGHADSICPLLSLMLRVSLIATAHRAVLDQVLPESGRGVSTSVTELSILESRSFHRAKSMVELSLLGSPNHDSMVPDVAGQAHEP